MARLAFRNITGNELVPNTRKITFYQDNGNNITLNVVNYNICQDGMLISIPNENKEEVYNALKENEIYWNINNLGNHNTGIKLTNIDSYSK